MLDEELTLVYDNVPKRKLLFNYDLPRRHKSKPRYIKENDLDKLMEAVKKLKCPYKKKCHIISWWIGARREEIQRLDINALDY